MANPTFDGVDLFDEAARDMPGPIQSRLSIEAMPGIDGLYVQNFGAGERVIRAEGLISRAGATPAQAHQAAKSRLRIVQDLVTRGTVATYIGTDGCAYPCAVLGEFGPAGPLEMTRLSDSSYLGQLPCKAVIRQLDSSGSL
jgi:hypothetical protein